MSSPESLSQLAAEAYALANEPSLYGSPEFAMAHAQRIERAFLLVGRLAMHHPVLQVPEVGSRWRDPKMANAEVLCWFVNATEVAGCYGWNRSGPLFTISVEQWFRDFTPAGDPQ